MRFRFILSETWNSLKRNVSMIISVMLVTFISFLFIGVSGLMQAQITAAKGEWYDTVEVAFQPGDRRSGERDQRGSRQHRLQNHICEP